MMQKSNRKVSLIVLVLILVALILLVSFRHSNRSQHYISSRTPTILVHGYNSSYHAWDQLIRTAKARGITKTVEVAEVKKDGRVVLHGQHIQGRRNPIVAVNFDANKRRNTAADARANEVGLDHVIVTLQRKEGMRRYNIVGHSMGNWNSLCFIADHGRDRSLPRLKKQVVLAGGGTHGWAQINNPGWNNYVKRRFAKLTHNYPRVPVLNIYGNLGAGSHSDGVVPNKVSRNLKVALGNRPTSYRQVEISGRHAQHSALRTNPRVINLIIHFLWQN